MIILAEIHSNGKASETQEREWGALPKTEVHYVVLT